MLAYTSSPDLQRVTPEPTSAITPAASNPRMKGNFTGQTRRSMPLRRFQSIGFTLVAQTRSTTCFAPGAGLSISRSVNRSADPQPSIPPAFMPPASILHARLDSDELLRQQEQTQRDPERG